MKQLQWFAVVLLPFLSVSAAASTETSIWPWQSLAGAYNSAVNDGRILAYPDDLSSDGRFFRLVENSIMTMTADNGGFSRSAAPIVEQCIPEICAPDPLTKTQICSFGPSDPACIAQMPWQPGDRWENSNGGRGFTNSFCGGYPQCPWTPQLDMVLGGPPTAMDGGWDMLSPGDVASGGWPSALLAFVQNYMLAYTTMNAPICIAPAGLDDSEAHSCAPGMTYRASRKGLFASPDAGRQWYPFAASCSLSDRIGASAIAVDPGNPSHVVTANSAKDNPKYGEASGCSVAPLCAQRSVAWTADVSSQIITSIIATMPGAEDTTHAVDKAGGPNPNSDASGWRYAALGHLATGQDCDVAHAGIQLGCAADTSIMCHAQKPTGANPSQEAFCPDYTDGRCKCFVAGSSIATANCQFPEATSLAIDPRNGQVYAPSAALNQIAGSQTLQTGLLFSPDGGRKWRRHGHSYYLKWGSDGGMAQTTEPWPYTEDPDPFDAYTDTVPDAGNDPGVRILTMQGLPIPPGAVAPSAVGDAWALDLNAQPELLVHLGRVTIVSTPCGSDPVAGEGVQYVAPAGLSADAPGYPRDRVHVVATVTAVWHDPLTPRQFSGVFVAHGDSCTDAAARVPLVFRDTANLMPAGIAATPGLTQYTAPLGILDSETHWSPDSEPKSIDGKPVVKLPQFQTANSAGGGAGPMMYAAAAVSPSDPRVLHAWGWCGDCVAQTGLWRSVDGGASFPRDNYSSHSATIRIPRHA